MRRRGIVTLVLVGGLAAVAVSVAAAGPTPVKTRLSVRYSGRVIGGDYTGNPYNPYTPTVFSGAFNGRLRARHGCRAGRRVTISKGIGRTRSDSRGRFVVGLDEKPPRGTYKATVARRRTVRHGEKVVCRRASRKVRVRR